MYAIWGSIKKRAAYNVSNNCEVEKKKGDSNLHFFYLFFFPIPYIFSSIF